MAENREDYAVEFFLQAAQEDMKYGWGTTSQSVEKDGISQPTAYRAQERLVEAGLLEKDSRGAHYNLTEKGEELIDQFLSIVERYSSKV